MPCSTNLKFCSLFVRLYRTCTAHSCWCVVGLWYKQSASDEIYCYIFFLFSSSMACTGTRCSFPATCCMYLTEMVLSRRIDTPTQQPIEVCMCLLLLLLFKHQYNLKEHFDLPLTIHVRARQVRAGWSLAVAAVSCKFAYNNRVVAITRSTIWDDIQIDFAQFSSQKTLKIKIIVQTRASFHLNENPKID